MRLQSEIVTALLLLLIGAFVIIIIYNIISPNLNIINPTGQEISKSIKLNFQLLDYFIVNNTLYAYVKPSEPVNYSQVFAILNGRLVKVYPYNSNGSIVNPYNNGLLIIVANLSQTPPNQNGNYKLEVGLENAIIGSFTIEYISNPLINYFQPPIVLNISDLPSDTPICQPSYLTLILYNTQNIPTPSPFQQQIAICNGTINIGPNFAYVNNVTLFNLINSNGSNVYFTTTCNGTPNIYSWYEGQLINGSTYCKVWWIKLDNGISANSSVTIYMYIGPNSANYYQQYYPYAGQAPQLSSIYGQYDNGDYVFLFYDNFKGTSLNISKWRSFVRFAGGIIINNSVTVKSMTATAGMITLSGFNPTSTIADFYITYASNRLPAISMTIDNSAHSSGYFALWSGTGRSDCCGSYFGGIFISGGYTWSYPAIVSESWQSSSLQIYGSNYTYTTKSFTIYSLPSLVYYGFGCVDPSYNGTITVQWVRVRAYPPNGIMPSIYIS